MQFVILDLEWNTAYSSKLSRFINEIIEFGAVKLNEDLEVIDSFSSLVKPKIEKKLRGRVKTLTNITNEDVAEADGFETVCERFTEWVGDIDNTVIMSWGDMDIRVLIDDCKYFFEDDPRIPFVKYYVDLQAYFMYMMDLPKTQQIGLSNAATLIDENPDEFVHHRALGDSELSAVCFKKVFNENSINSYIVECNDDFYKRILFKPYVITDINDTLVDKTAMNCMCHTCGKQATQLTDWKVTNSSFTALFYCKPCKTKYRVSIQYKKNYSQLNIKKTVTVVPKKDDRPAQNERGQKCSRKA